MRHLRNLTPGDAVGICAFAAICAVALVWGPVMAVVVLKVMGVER